MGVAFDDGAAPKERGVKLEAALLQIAWGQGTLDVEAAPEPGRRRFGCTSGNAQLVDCRHRSGPDIPLARLGVGGFRYGLPGASR